MHQIIDPVQDDLTPFADAGGKMLIFQGWGDIAQSPYRTIRYYDGLRRHTGRRNVEDFARLFMAPGMYHCGGGVGPNTFDALTAIEQWVEGGQAPSSILASHTVGPGVNRTRPLCPFPQHAVYKGTGSIDDATNFECSGPPVGSGRPPALTPNRFVMSEYWRRLDQQSLQAMGRHSWPSCTSQQD